jgi:hypothetical protein
MDMQAIASALSAINALKTIGEGIVAARDQLAFQEKLIAVHSALNAAQSTIIEVNEARASLSKKVDELEEKIAQMSAWAAEKQRYELVNLAEGVFAYRLKADAANGEPVHEICPQCYEQRRKSILQKQLLDIGRAEKRVCTACEFEVYVHGQWSKEHGPAGRRR